MHACEECARRAWLLARLSGHLDLVRGRIAEVLELGDDQLIAAVAGRDRAIVERESQAVDAAAQRSLRVAAGVEAVCRCDPLYPRRLRDLPCPPAVLHVAGGVHRLAAVGAERPVAIVGTRRPSAYGAQMARSLARGLASADVPVLSGLAAGIDSAAHAGALDVASADARLPSVAVLPGGAERAYPRSGRALHARIVDSGAAVSELPPGVAVRRWMFPARNRIIAAMSAMTIVVEAGDRSGALITARWARSLGRELGAVPGRVTSPQATGTNALLAEGASVVCGAQPVLDLLYGAGVRDGDRARKRPRLDDRPAALLSALADGHELAEALPRAGLGLGDGLAALSSLELAGYVRRDPGGRYTVLP